CTMGLEFAVVKLLDLGADLAALEANTNPFAPLVLAHLQTQATRQDPAARQEWKLRVVKGLFQRGFTSHQIRQLLRLIDWMMDLPRELELEFRNELTRFAEEKNMPYLTGLERLAMEEGKAQGKAEGKAQGKAEGMAETLIKVLERRFASKVPADLEGRI